MKHLSEISRSPSRKAPKNIQNILSQIKLFEVYPKIFAVVIKDDKLRARVFMRYQEFYESDSDTFRGKGFKWTEFVDYYKKKTKNDILSYHEDWTGYNIPCDSIESCISLIPDINFYDLIMFSIVDTVRSIVGSDKFYLIGIDQAEGEDKSLIEHELAHGLWFASPKYKADQLMNIDQLPEYIEEPLKSKISGMGYGPNVVDDEIQAYLSTGIIPPMNRIKDIKKYIIKFHETFKKFASQMSVKQIPINWNTDLNV
jgi:hypothetical protein